ncbi:MAG: DNA polymerase III subunit gamma/tau C-terminal domain-containing protein, partial [Methylococcales bacterium]
GLSLLDQAIAQGAGRVEAHWVDRMLGIVAESPIAELLFRLAENDAAGLLDCVAYLADLTQDFSQILQQLLVQLHRLALIQAIPERLDEQEVGDTLSALAKKISPADLQLYYQIGLIGRRDIDLAPDSRSGFEMLLLRMLAFRPAALRGAIESADSRTVLSKEAPPVAEMNEASNQPAVHAGVHSSAQSGQDAHGLEWPRIIQAMAVNGLAKELASYSLLEKVDETGITLILDPSHQSLRSKRVEQRLEDALQNYYQRPLKLTIRIENSELATPASEHSARRKSLQLAAETSIANDANVRALKETFDAKILPGSTQPREAL